MVGDVLYQPIVQQYDRRRFGNEAVDAVLASNGHDEELTEFQALVAMGQTHQALQMLMQAAEKIMPQVLAEARRDAASSSEERKKAARAALDSGHVTASTVSRWVREALKDLHSPLVDKDGDFHKAICNYFEHTPFREAELL